METAILSLIGKEMEGVSAILKMKKANSVLAPKTRNTISKKGLHGQISQQVRSLLVIRQLVAFSMSRVRLVLPNQER